jgi:hypothetical protein
MDISRPSNALGNFLQVLNVRVSAIGDNSLISLVWSCSIAFVITISDCRALRVFFLSVFWGYIIKQNISAGHFTKTGMPFIKCYEEHSILCNAPSFFFLNFYFIFNPYPSNIHQVSWEKKKKKNPSWCCVELPKL